MTRRWERATGREAVLEGTEITFAQVARERGVEAVQESGESAVKADQPEVSHATEAPASAK